MGRPKKLLGIKPPSAAPEPQAPSAPVKINLYEAGALKSNMDEVAKEVVLNAGYEEELYISTVKICLGLLAIGSALFAQFGPGKFPSNWWIILGCVVAYIFLTLALNWYSTKMEGEAFLVTKSLKGQKGLKLSSRLVRFTDQFSLHLADRKDRTRQVSCNVSLTNFFHSDGYMAVEPWKAEVQRLLCEFESKAGQDFMKKNE